MASERDVSEPYIVEAMARAWGKWQHEPGFPFSPDHCINGTRVVCRAMEKLGVRAQPVSVQFALFNRFAWALFSEGVPVSEWPDHAWSLGVGPGHVKGTDRWDGHLVAEGTSWTLDISAAQFNRPGRITVSGPRIMPKLPPVGRGLVLDDEYGQRLIISRWPANRTWRTSGGWMRLHGTEVAELVARTKQLTAEQTIDGKEGP